jgi:hypothetical protein
MSVNIRDGIEYVQERIAAGFLPRYWKEKITSKNRQSYPTVYPIYFTGATDMTSSLTGFNAPKSQREAEEIADHVIRDPENGFTHAMIYKQEAVARVGIRFEKPKGKK